jgi:hypothetical protein
MVAIAQTAFARMVARDVVPLLRAYGYRGTAGTWVLTAPSGDAAIVNLQKSRWNTSDELAFTVNLAVVPVPWFEWEQHRMGLSAATKLREYYGLWRDRLDPSPGLSQDGDFWMVRDEASANACGMDVVAKLQRVGLPRLSALLDRKVLTEAIEAGDFGYIKMDPVVPFAVMLSDHGPSDELEEALRRLDSLPDWSDWKLKDAFVDWIRQRSESHRRQPT